MKSKLLAGALLIVAIATFFLVWRGTNSSRKTNPQTEASHATQSPATVPALKTPSASLPSPVPLTASRMTHVTPESAMSSAANDGKSPNWSAIQEIVNSGAHYETRMRAFSRLSPQFTDMDWEVVQRFLLKADAADRNQQVQTVKNQLMDILCAMDPPPAGLGDVFARIYHDRQQNEVMRDYAVQHLAAYYEQMSGQANSEKALQATQNVLFEALQERGGSIGGTALLALKRLSQEYAAAFDQNKIGSTALQMAADNFSGELTHITAYQVCAQLKVAEALPILVRAAEQGDSIAVRLSAIGSLGLLGGAEQVPTLEGFINGPEERLKPAARHALDQIKARENSQQLTQN